LDGGALVTGEDLIWHVVIGSEQHGPLSRAHVLEYLHDERLVGTDLIWRPGFSDWKSISEITDFWQPPKQGSLRPPPMPAPTEQPERDNDQINAVATNKKWSIWRAANAGLLVSVLPLALQIANGRGVELASYAQTASAETVLFLGGQILAGPLLFVIIALVRNTFKWRLPKSDARAIEGAIVFSLLLLGIGLSLALYGQWFFGSNERISGGTRDYFMSKMQPVCVQRQMSLKQGANPSDDQISKYCTCVSIQMADNTTYKRLASDSTAPDVREHLKQQTEAAGQACRTWVR
jgi:uncharacterized integral membrane protein